MQFSEAFRNAAMNQFEAQIGTAATLEIRTGAEPANCAAADSGTLLAEISLPADALSAAAAGVVAKNGTWEDTSADATGTAGHFRIKHSGGTCHCQGDITLTSGGGDMELDNTSLVASQSFEVTAFSLTAGGA